MMNPESSETIILASASPRRSELLTLAGIPFEVFIAAVEEKRGLPAPDEVRINAELKAKAVAARFPGRFVLAADTLVELDGTVLGKPSGPEDAFRMLKSLSGHTHHVLTGVTVISPEGAVFTDVDCSSVTFDPVPDAELEAYVRSGEPLDKAGAYAVQGKAALWIRRLEGCWSSVVGLPLYMVRSLLIRSGYAGFGS